MKKFFFFIACYCLLIICACSNSVNENVDIQHDTDSFNEVKEVAWKFINDQGWIDSAKGNWQEAEVSRVIVNNQYKLLDDSYKGKEALSVSFENKKNVVVGTPVILIDMNAKKVIGYMLGE
ncbi:hypothetical protein [Solibacillus sp. CAU 1738]|uniref:hypothetical protein n=1 Tax=Solibacillus sp. CAU 1738 TaxID=3140363 RepID=UPI0032619D87